MELVNRSQNLVQPRRRVLVNASETFWAWWWPRGDQGYWFRRTKCSNPLPAGFPLRAQACREPSMPPLRNINDDDQPRVSSPSLFPSRWAAQRKTAQRRIDCTIYSGNRLSGCPV